MDLYMLSKYVRRSPIKTTPKNSLFGPLIRLLKKSVSHPKFGLQQTAYINAIVACILEVLEIFAVGNVQYLSGATARYCLQPARYYRSAQLRQPVLSD